MSEQRRLLWTVTDPRGLCLSLAEDVWQVHLAKHRELEGKLDFIRLCAQDPDKIHFDPVSSATKSLGTKVYFYYKRDLLQGELADNLVEVCIKVVVKADDIAQGYVQSAMFPNQVRKRAVLEWEKSK